MIKQLVLRKEILATVKRNPVLLGTIASALGVSAYTMPRILAANDRRLTQASVLKVLREHLNVSKDADLLTEQLPQISKQIL